MNRELLENMMKALEAKFEEKEETNIVTTFINKSIDLQYSNEITVVDIEEVGNKLEFTSTHGLTFTIGLNCCISYESIDTYFFRYEDSTLIVISII